MTTPEERQKILRMIQDGKISPEDGIALLEVLGSKKPGASSAPASQPASASPPSEGRWFRVQVTDTRTGRTRVNLRMPISMVRAGMKMGARFAPQVKGLEAGALIEMLNSGSVGRIIDVYDEEDGEHVEVFID